MPRRMKLWMTSAASDYWLDNSVCLEEKMTVDSWVWNLLWACNGWEFLGLRNSSKREERPL